MKTLFPGLLLSLTLASTNAGAQQSLVQAEVPDRPASGALGALNNAVTVNVSGRIGVGGYVTTGTLSGTITPEVTIDGTNWLATSVYNFSAGAAPVRATSLSLNTLFGIELPAGAKQARIRVSVYTSGTSTGTLLATTDAGAAPLSAVVSGTVTTTPPANASTNVAQINGTTTDSNSGTKSAGTIRVVLATDQPQLTNKLLVTPDSVALPANQSVNVAQIAGTNTVTGGVSGLIAVGGNVANAVAATANPVPVGGIFTTTPATLTTGQTATMQFTAAQNQKHDLTTIAGTAPTTVGKIDVKGADGDVFVRQATGTNLHAVIDTTSTTAATQATASNLKVEVSPVPVSSSNNDGTCTDVTVSATILASFATRRGAVIINRCDPAKCSSTTGYIKLGATAATTDFPLAPGDKFVLQGPAVYSGAIDAIADSGTVTFCAMEF